MTREEIGARIRQLRLQAGISQQSAADHAGVSRTIWQQYESGTRNPSIRRVPAIAAALDCPLAAIFRSDAIADLTLSDEARARIRSDHAYADTLAATLASRIAPALLANATQHKQQQRAVRAVNLAAPLQVAERLLASRRASVAIAERQVEAARRAEAVE